MISRQYTPRSLSAENLDTMLSLGDLSSTSGLEQLEKHLQDRTYVSG